MHGVDKFILRTADILFSEYKDYGSVAAINGED
jgi:hypothetical protein